MGKSLIITEKPSVAREFATVLHVNGRQNGYIENEQYVITWCVGHLVEMVYPEVYDEKYKTWRLEDLPFLPENYIYDVKKEVKSQYDIVHRMLQREDVDRVYWAGDAGKEGQTIEENIRNFGGVREGMEELRVWIDSQTEEEILRGIREAKPMSAYANLGKSGIMRTIEDYAMGINFSRVMSVKYGKLLNDAAGTASYTAIAVGRVMTCVLGMVVIREREIRNFKETPFYRVIGKFTDAAIECEWKVQEGSRYFESPLLYKENGFKEEKDAIAFMTSLEGKTAQILNVEKSITKKRAPLLFNLAELQAECSKRFKISPNETLQVAQELYEKKLTTYPRTDARVLSTAIAKEIAKNISKLRQYEPVHSFVEHIMSNQLYANIAKTQYTDDSKVTDHYAIIPTGQLTELNSLNSLQRAVFDVIVRRFLSIFYPPAEYENVKLAISVENDEKKEAFFTSAKVLKKQGYLEVAASPKKQSFEEENARILGGMSVSDTDSSDGDGTNAEDGVKVNPKILLELAERLHSGDVVSVQGYEIKFGKTSPPKRYTSGSMVLAMENAGQLIEEEELREQIKGSGIGTSATRAEIIQKLVRIHYLNLNSKTQILTPNNLGEMVFEVVSMTVPALLNPKMTASWEKGLEGITQGTVDFWDYRKKLEEFIRKETLAMVQQDIRHELADRISYFAGKSAKGAGARRRIGAVCPKCGGDIVTTPFGYGCVNYKADKSGCNFNLGEVAGKSIPEEQVLKLLGEEGRTDTLRGFKSKTGKRFDACLVLRKDDVGEATVQFDFEHVEEEILPEVVCPACGGQIKKTSFGYGCVNYRPNEPDSCRFSVGQIAGKSLSAANVKQLCTEKKTGTIRGFKAKNGSKFDACLVLKEDENGRLGVTFDFEGVEQKVIADCKCPICGGEIVATPFGYGCANYQKDNPQSCRFSVGEMAGKKLNETQVKQLLTTGKTETIRGFKSKEGKKFDACVVLAKDEQGKITGLKFDFSEVEPLTLKDVNCPVCNGKIAITPFGYGCTNYRKDDPDSCRFMIGKIAGVKLKPDQVTELLLRKKTATIRGFVSKNKKKFDARLILDKDEHGKFTEIKFDFDDLEPVTLKDVSCPLCGGKIAVVPFGYVCVNNKQEDEDSCRFMIGKIAGVKLKENQVRELLKNKKTGEIKGFVAKTGMMFDAPLKLTEEGKVEFDFPKKQEPVESTLACPKCGMHMKKARWRYECECGFAIRHTVAQVELSEAILKELFTTGKTKQRIVGFVSKAGSVFDACLKYENEEIKFDFDNPGVMDPNSTYKNLNLTEDERKEADKTSNS